MITAVGINKRKLFIGLPGPTDQPGKQVLLKTLDRHK